MNKPGRNDPCYCGSGKKYKQCHMAADLAAEREQRAFSDAAQFLRLDLPGYADQERFAPALTAALPRYWNGLYTYDNRELMSLSEEERFYDWFVFDYVLEEGDDSGKRVVELYQADNAARLTPQQRALLEAWIQAGPLAAYEFTGYDRQTLHLGDFMTGEVVDVFEPAGHGQTPLGALILARLVPVNDRLEFSALPAYIPPGEIADLGDRLAAAKEADAEAFPGGTHADFMRRHNVLLIHHALEKAQEAGRPPVARLDPRHRQEAVPHRERHERIKVKGPNNLGETLPHMVSTRRKI